MKTKLKEYTLKFKELPEGLIWVILAGIIIGFGNWSTPFYFWGVVAILMSFKVVETNKQ